MQGDQDTAVMLPVSHSPTILRLQFTKPSIYSIYKCCFVVLSPLYWKKKSQTVFLNLIMNESTKIKYSLLNFSGNLLCMNQENNWEFVFIQLLLTLEFAQCILLCSEYACLWPDISFPPPLLSIKAESNPILLEKKAILAPGVQALFWAEISGLERAFCEERKGTDNTFGNIRIRTASIQVCLIL